MSRLPKNKKLKINKKKYDNNFLDNWKMRVKHLERDEKEEIQNNKEIKKYKIIN